MVQDCVDVCLQQAGGSTEVLHRVDRHDKNGVVVSHDEVS